MRTRRAFTVLELVVVIGVILILMALALSVTSSVLAANDRRSMENTFKLLDQAISSWEAQMGRELTFARRAVPGSATLPPDYTGTPSVAYDIYEVNTGDTHAVCLVLERLSVAGSESQEILSKMPSSALRYVLMAGTVAAGGPLPANWTPNVMPPMASIREIVDPWGRRIATCFPGRAATKAELANPAVPTDANDGTVRTLDEMAMGVCRNRRIFFLSAGPDGDTATTNDNIYSYEPLPRP